jgi:hypothetical protein
VNQVNLSSAWTKIAGGAVRSDCADALVTEAKIVTPHDDPWSHDNLLMLSYENSRRAVLFHGWGQRVRCRALSTVLAPARRSGPRQTEARARNRRGRVVNLAGRRAPPACGASAGTSADCRGFLTVDGCNTSEQFSDPRSRRGNVAPNASLRQMPCAHEVRLHHPTSH